MLREEDVIEYGNGKESESCDEDTGDGTCSEGHFEAGSEAMTCGFCGSDVGSYRDEHTGIAGDAGKDGPNDKADGRKNGKEESQDDGDNNADNGDSRILAVEISPSALLDGFGYGNHFFVTGRGFEYGVAGDKTVDDSDKTTSDDKK